MYAFMWICIWECSTCRSQKHQYRWPLQLELQLSGESPGMDARNLLEKQQVLLLPEPSLQPCLSILKHLFLFYFKQQIARNKNSAYARHGAENFTDTHWVYPCHSPVMCTICTLYAWKFIGSEKLNNLTVLLINVRNRIWTQVWFSRK